MSYVDEFLKLKCAGDVMNICNPINKAAKEISESMAIIHKVRNVALAYPGEYTMIDFCCGAHGLTGVLAAHLLPLQKVIAVDIRQPNRKFENVKRYHYIQGDIMDSDLMATIINLSSGKIILTATHACGELSKRIITIFNHTGYYKGLVLMPCCRGNMPIKVPQVIVDKIGNYLAWSWSLAQMAGGKLTVDEKIISPCNAIVTVSR